jgi:hypothetical protein
MPLSQEPFQRPEFDALMKLLREQSRIRWEYKSESDHDRPSKGASDHVSKWRTRFTPLQITTSRVG